MNRIFLLGRMVDMPTQLALPWIDLQCPWHSTSASRWGKDVYDSW